jgi:hypothetical protein
VPRRIELNDGVIPHAFDQQVQMRLVGRRGRLHPPALREVHHDATQGEGPAGRIPQRKSAGDSNAFLPIMARDVLEQPGTIRLQHRGVIGAENLRLLRREYLRVGAAQDCFAGQTKLLLETTVHLQIATRQILYEYDGGAAVHQRTEQWNGHRRRRTRSLASVDLADGRCFALFSPAPRHICAPGCGGGGSGILSVSAGGFFPSHPRP